MMKKLAILCLPLGLLAIVAQGNEPPQIRHQPVATAVRDQPLSVMARVTDDSGVVRAVTLFFALSRDAAPFRIPMKRADGDLYVGTIAPEVIGGAEQFLYYIEATDADEASSETPWYTVQVRTAPAGPPTARPPEQPPSPHRRERSPWLGVGLIAGGAAAVGAAAIVVANQDDDEDGNGQADYAGIYRGTSTECLTLTGQAPSCDTRAITINIDANGTVLSENLRPNRTLTGRLSGNGFVLVANLADEGTNLQGNVYYHGTILDKDIVGQISGTYQSPDSQGTYSGSFNARRP